MTAPHRPGQWLSSHLQGQPTFCIVTWHSSALESATALQFMATPQRRARYWARSFAGWHEFREVQPNRAHAALARLQRNGWVSALLTQNVDRLHHKAGSRGVIELHGTTHRWASAVPAAAVLWGRTCREADTSTIYAQHATAP